MDYFFSLLKWHSFCKIDFGNIPEGFMLEQMHLGKKLNRLKTLYQKLMKRLSRATDQNPLKQKQSKLNPDLYEFQPSDQVGTAPRLKNVRLSD
jgi:hypothetical protein